MKSVRLVAAILAAAVFITSCATRGGAITDVRIEEPVKLVFQADFEGPQCGVYIKVEGYEATIPFPCPEPIDDQPVREPSGAGEN